MLTVADHVLAGRRPFNDAYAEAVAIRDRKPSAEARPEQLKPAAPEPTKAAPASPLSSAARPPSAEPQPADDASLTGLAAERDGAAEAGGLPAPGARPLR